MCLVAVLNQIFDLVVVDRIMKVKVADFHITKNITKNQDLSGFNKT